MLDERPINVCQASLLHSPAVKKTKKTGIMHTYGAIRWQSVSVLTWRTVKVVRSLLGTRLDLLDSCWSSSSSDAAGGPLNICGRLFSPSSSTSWLRSSDADATSRYHQKLESSSYTLSCHICFSAAERERDGTGYRPNRTGKGVFVCLHVWFGPVSLLIWAVPWATEQQSLTGSTHTWWSPRVIHAWSIRPSSVFAWLHLSSSQWWKGTTGGATASVQCVEKGASIQRNTHASALSASSASSECTNGKIVCNVWVCLDR